MFDSIRYSKYLGVAIYNDGLGCDVEMVIDFRSGEVYYANQYYTMQPCHYLF